MSNSTCPSTSSKSRPWLWKSSFSPASRAALPASVNAAAAVRNPSHGVQFGGNRRYDDPLRPQRLYVGQRAGPVVREPLVADVLEHDRQPGVVREPADPSAEWPNRPLTPTVR